MKLKIELILFDVVYRGCTHLTQCDAPFIFFRGTEKEFTDPPLDKYIAHQLSMDICHAFLKKNLLHGKSVMDTTYRLLCTIIADPEYQGAVPILDGGEGASEHLIYGTNIDWKTEEQGEMPSQPTSLEPVTTQDDDQHQPNGLTGESASEEPKELPKEEEPREEPKELPAQETIKKEPEDEVKEDTKEEPKEEPKEDEAKELPKGAKEELIKELPDEVPSD